jgi:hypothetical protein
MEQNSPLEIQPPSTTFDNSSMKLLNGVYWRKKEDGTDEGPFCPKCWIDKQKAIPMVPNEAHGNNKCVSCDRTDVPSKTAGVFHSIPLVRR